MRCAELPLVTEHYRITEAVSIDGIVLRRVVRVVAAGIGLRSAGTVLSRASRRYRVAGHL